LGHPLLGDKLYKLQQDELGPAREADASEPTACGLERHALHACLLGFIHPGTKQWIEFAAPLPADLAQCLAQLNAFE
jgi:23S rRNA pseudouridine1911/1915/1917 synthase